MKVDIRKALSVILNLLKADPRKRGTNRAGARMQDPWKGMNFFVLIVRRNQTRSV